MLRTRVVMMFLVLLVIQGCHVSQQNPCALSDEVWNGLEELDSLANDPLVRQRHAMWMKYNFDEPSIIDADNEVYRFRMDCSGSSNYSKIVRIERTHSDLNVVIKEFDGVTGSADTDGSVTIYELSEEDWESLMAHLENCNFWTSILECDKTLLHGCAWHIEAYNPEGNHCTQKNYHQIGGCYPLDSSLASLHNFFRDLNQK